jgi:hypothetical protein
VLINESLARAFWPNENPVGQFLRVTTPDAKASKESKGWYVEGVLPDIRGSIREPAVCCVYGPETWAPGNESTFVVRLARPYDDALAGLIRRESLLYETSPQDPWMLAGVVGILVATAIMASALPAYQAAKVDVSRLLRRE